MSIIKNFPSAADLDLDMWKAGRVGQSVRDGEWRSLDAGQNVLRIYSANAADRDTTARRIEMLGDLYDTLHEQTERARQAGLDVSQAMRVMQEFVAPKPFSANPDQDDVN